MRDVRVHFCQLRAVNSHHFAAIVCGLVNVLLNVSNCVIQRLWNASAPWCCPLVRQTETNKQKYNKSKTKVSTFVCLFVCTWFRPMMKICIQDASINMILFIPDAWTRWLYNNNDNNQDVTLHIKRYLKVGISIYWDTGKISLQNDDWKL